MTSIDLKTLKAKLFFTPADIAHILGIKQVSALVFCNRYVKRGIFVRVKRNVYVLHDAWEKYSTGDLMEIANYLQVPSYISLSTALSFYGLTTQVQQNYIESISLKRSVSYLNNGVTFEYYKINKNLYSDFVKNGKVFIAAKEKALADSLYLLSFGKYAFDAHAVDFSKFDRRKLKEVLKKYPAQTRKMAEKYAGID